MHSLVVLAVLVYAPPSGKAGGQLPEVAQALKRALRAGGAEVVDGAVDKARAQHARGWVDEARLAFFKDARGLAGEGRRALERVELPRAEAQLASAEEVYRKELARPGVAALMSAVALDRGRALYDQGKALPAAQAFRRARALDPAAQLTEATVRPVVARAFEQAVAPPKAQGPLTVLVTAPGAAEAPAPGALEAPSIELTVDGRALAAAEAPVVVGVGEHLVSASAPGRVPVAVLVDVAPEGARVELPLAPDPELEALALLRTRPAQPGTLALARALGVDGVVAVALGVDAGVLTLVGQRLTASGCATAVQTERAAGSVDRAAEALTRRLSSAAERCDGPAADGSQLLEAPPIAHPRAVAAAKADKPKPRKPKFYERPWLWAGLLVVTSVAVGVTAALVTQETQFQASLEGRKFSIDQLGLAP